MGRTGNPARFEFQTNFGWDPSFESKIDEWLYFFKEAEHWQDIPEIINNPKMRQAMAVLERFSEKERDYHLYQARQNAIREEQARPKLLEEGRARQGRGDAEGGRSGARQGRGGS